MITILNSMSIDLWNSKHAQGNVCKRTKRQKCPKAKFRRLCAWQSLWAALVSQCFHPQPREEKGNNPERLTCSRCIPCCVSVSLRVSRAPSPSSQDRRDALAQAEELFFFCTTTRHSAAKSLQANKTCSCWYVTSFLTLRHVKCVISIGFCCGIDSMGR